MAIFLTWLADELRAAGLTVVEFNGWRTRARGSGGYASNPLCVMWHHTASGASWDGQRDAAYCATGDPSAPLSNLYIQRDGTVWVLAAGATNTNGKGNSMKFSRGTVPQDGMNTRAVGVEMGNNGVGEAWPCAQVDAMFAVSNTVNKRLGNQPTDCAGHWDYAPTRKIDPARASSVQGPWCPGSANSSGTWRIADVRNECVRRAGASPIPPTPGPTPPKDDDDMLFDGFWRRENSQAVYAIWKNGTKQWMTDPGYLNAMTNLQAINGATAEQLSVRVMDDPAMFAAFGLVLGPREPSTDEWGNIV